jgi:hypothetical protein
LTPSSEEIGSYKGISKNSTTLLFLEKGKGVEGVEAVEGKVLEMTITNKKRLVWFLMHDSLLLCL